jgi:hypothetical protein
MEYHFDVSGRGYQIGSGIREQMGNQILSTTVNSHWNIWKKFVPVVRGRIRI